MKPRMSSLPDESAARQMSYGECGGASVKGGANWDEVAGMVLRALSEAAGPARLADLARATSGPPAKIHRSSVSLVRTGLVEQDPATNRYDFGPLSLRAGIVTLTGVISAVKVPF